MGEKDRSKDKVKGEKKPKNDGSGVQRNSGGFRSGGGDPRTNVNSPHPRPLDGAGDRWSSNR